MTTFKLGMHRMAVNHFKILNLTTMVLLSIILCFASGCRKRISTGKLHNSEGSENAPLIALIGGNGSCASGKFQILSAHVAYRRTWKPWECLLKKSLNGLSKTTLCMLVLMKKIYLSSSPALISYQWKHHIPRPFRSY